MVFTQSNIPPRSASTYPGPWARLWLTKSSKSTAAAALTKAMPLQSTLAKLLESIAPRFGFILPKVGRHSKHDRITYLTSHENDCVQTSGPRPLPRRHFWFAPLIRVKASKCPPGTALIARGQNGRDLGPRIAH